MVTTGSRANQLPRGEGRIAAMTLIAVAELERYGLRVNAIAPIARTRLTKATPGMGALMAEPEGGDHDLFSPANISPLVCLPGYRKMPDHRTGLCRTGRSQLATQRVA